MITRAERINDCLHRVRYRYTLASAVDHALLRCYADSEAYEVSTYDAGHLLPHAHLTFQIQARDGGFMMNGALGLAYVTVTYMRNGQLDANQAVQEAILSGLP